MTTATLIANAPIHDDSSVWESLKQAIANSSGFKCWQEEQNPEINNISPSLDFQVRHYLRQTLETLAY
ncbi:MAG: hypothetical protein VKL41_05155 [Snowella sp.]|jgi:hypothetical protein|nr:hypothetical protein [Snowella sp.]PZV25254.1 MAG: hypothetical protein DCF12_15905 [Snowella sp.]